MLHIASQRSLKKIVACTESYFDALIKEDYDRLYNEEITLESINLLSFLAWPLICYQINAIDAILRSYKSTEFGFEISGAEALSTAFENNYDNCRSFLFYGLRSEAMSYGWHLFDRKEALALEDDDFGVLIAQTNEKVFPHFVRSIQGDFYKTDFIAMWLFSSTMSASMVYEIAKRAQELGNELVAKEFLQVTCQMQPIYRRIFLMVTNHPLTGKLITTQRKSDIYNQLQIISKAKNDLRLLTNKSKSTKDVQKQIALKKLITKAFNLEDLKEICFAMGLEFEDLEGATKSAKIRELILRCQREQLMYSLITTCFTLRPEIDWTTENQT